MSYAKLFSDILASTIWATDSSTRIVWITMLAMADKQGDVMASVPGLAHLARVPVDDVRQALEVLLSEDPDSRTPDHEGRRIAEIDGGWAILNYEKHRKRASEEDQKEKAAERQRRHRAGKSSRGVTPSNAACETVTPPSGDGVGDGAGAGDASGAGDTSGCLPSPSLPPISTSTPSPGGVGGDSLEQGDGDGGQPLARLLMATKVRSSAKNRKAVLGDIARALWAQGVSVVILRDLIRKSREEGADPAALLSHWIGDGTSTAWRGKLKERSR